MYQYTCLNPHRAFINSSKPALTAERKFTVAAVDARAQSQFSSNGTCKIGMSVCLSVSERLGRQKEIAMVILGAYALTQLFSSSNHAMMHLH